MTACVFTGFSRGPLWMSVPAICKFSAGVGASVSPVSPLQNPCVSADTGQITAFPLSVSLAFRWHSTGAVSEAGLYTASRRDEIPSTDGPVETMRGRAGAFVRPDAVRPELSGRRCQQIASVGLQADLQGLCQWRGAQ
jgi:hypothetical protein